jgi:hypothetical protein
MVERDLGRHAGRGSGSLLSGGRRLGGESAPLLQPLLAFLLPQLNGNLLALAPAVVDCQALLELGARGAVRSVGAVHCGECSRWGCRNGRLGIELNNSAGNSRGTGALLEIR